MGNGLLEPRQDFGGGGYCFGGFEAVHLVGEPHLDSTIPQPAYANVDFAVVDLLKLNREIRHDLTDSVQLLSRRALSSAARRVETPALHSRATSTGSGKSDSR